MTRKEAAEIFHAIKSKKDGPIKKFELIKAFGPAIRQSGSLDPKVMSCAELERQIKEWLDSYCAPIK